MPPSCATHTHTHACRACTRLLVTHQTQWLHACDRVLVLRDGAIVADGSWAQLRTDLTLHELQLPPGENDLAPDWTLPAPEIRAVGRGGLPPVAPLSPPASFGGYAAPPRHIYRVRPLSAPVGEGAHEGDSTFFTAVAAEGSSGRTEESSGLLEDVLMRDNPAFLAPSSGFETLLSNGAAPSSAPASSHSEAGALPVRVAAPPPLAPRKRPAPRTGRGAW